MACEHLMAKMTAKGVALEFSGSRGTKVVELSALDVSAALSFDRRTTKGRRDPLGRLPYLWGRLLYCGDRNVLPELVELLGREVRHEMVSGFHTPPDVSLDRFIGLAKVSIAEQLVVNRRICKRCNGQSSSCKHCNNRRLRPISKRKCSEISGISWATYRRHEGVFMHIVDLAGQILGHCEGLIASHLWFVIGSEEVG